MPYENDRELLLYALDNGMIDIDAIQQNILLNKRKKYLEKHTAGIWQGKNGCYYTYLPDEKAKNGRKLVKKTSMKAVEDAIVDCYKAMETEPYIGSVFHSWIDERLKYGEITKQTYDRYTNDYKRFIEGSRLEQYRFRYISEELLEEFIKSSIRENELTAKAWGNLRILIRGIFKYGRKKGFTSISITSFMGDLELSKNIFRQRIFTDEESVFTRKEVDKIVDYIDCHKESMINLGIKLVFETGLRAGELSALKAEDFDGNVITVRRTEIMYKDENDHCVFEVREKTKGRDGIRKVIVTDRAISILKRIMELNPDGEYLFMRDGERIRGNYFTVHLERICRNVGIRMRSLHKARKTYATELLNGGVDEMLVIKQMGHTDISTTKGFYYFDNREDSEAVKMIQNAIG